MTTRSTVQIDGENVSAGTIVEISPQSVATTLANQGSNISVAGNTSTGGTESGATPNAGASTRITPVSVQALAGTVNANTKNLPNIFFNFRQKTFPNSQNLLFKFETSKLAAGDFTGTKLPTWTADQTISSNISLTNATNPLSVVEAYGKYFYQLDRDKSISNVINLPIKTSPSYTVLVYAVARSAALTDSEGDIANKVNVVHSFYDNTNTALPSLNNKNFNIGLKNINFITLMGEKIPIPRPVASFVGNTLNSQVYSSGDQIESSAYKNFINISNPDYLTVAGFNNFLTKYNNFNNQKYDSFKSTNTSSFNNDISSPATVVPFLLNTKLSPPSSVITTVTLNNFSLYFVEMFSGITSSDNQNNYILTLQTFVNGILTYDGSMKLKKNSLLNDFGNFKISLSNMTNIATSADPNVKLFLFDYLHGVSNSSFSQMKLETRNITESLVYDYRNIMLKSTSDIQLCSNNLNKSLGFSPALSHPFLNIFFTKIA